MALPRRPDTTTYAYPRPSNHVTRLARARLDSSAAVQLERSSRGQPCKACIERNYPCRHMPTLGRGYTQNLLGPPLIESSADFRRIAISCVDWRRASHALLSTAELQASPPLHLRPSFAPSRVLSRVDKTTRSLSLPPSHPLQACSFAFTRRAARGPLCIREAPEPKPEWNFTGMRDSHPFLFYCFLSSSRISACSRASCHRCCCFLLLAHCF
jgi:hypothetical protein